MAYDPSPRDCSVVTFALRPTKFLPFEVPDLEEYRGLFRLGSRAWLWFSRLVMDDASRRDHPSSQGRVLCRRR